MPAQIIIGKKANGGEYPTKERAWDVVREWVDEGRIDLGKTAVRVVEVDNDGNIIEKK